MGKHRTVLPVTLGALAALGTTAYYLYATSRASVEIAGYTVIRRDGAFEIREYPALAVVRTTMRTAENDDAFLRLFRFIDRGNAEQRKIPMTAPVFIDGEHTMSFVLPAATAQRGAPNPAADDVELAERPLTRVAVHRYRGAMGRPGAEAALARLREWAERTGVAVEGESIVAYYDSPFIPGFLRRNEVMLRVAAP